jgi:zinc protease
MTAPRLRLVFPALLLGTALAGAAFAADDIKPEAILDKYVEATGGRAAYEKVQAEMSTGTLEIPTMGLTGTLTIYRAAPDKSYTLIDFSGVGKAEEGSNGQVAWSLSAMEGARIKEGEERALALRSDAFHGELRWRDFYKKAELAGSEDVGGKPCYKLVLTPNDGSPETRYYDKSSNLLVKVVLPISTPQMSGNAEVSLSDYKAEDGILSPHTISQKVPNAEFVVKISSVKYNPEIPAGRFDLPAEIKALTAPKSDKAEKK